MTVVEKDAHVWERHADDFYVEPNWVDERLFDVEFFEGEIYDPACGLGRIVEAAGKQRLEAFGADVVRRSLFCGTETDFLTTTVDVANIVSNPPYKLAERFAVHALKCAQCKVALLLPSKWLHGDTRSRWLEQTPLRRVWFLTPRPSMPPGSVIEAGVEAGGGTVDYAWFVWERVSNHSARFKNAGRPEIRWLRRDG